ncbi:MAG: glycoside hydrolase family 31 protein [Fimbriimonadaceae bacterium]
MVLGLLILTLPAPQGSLTVPVGTGMLHITAVASDVFRFDYAPDGHTGRPTDVLDPRGLRLGRAQASATDNELSTRRIQAKLDGDFVRVSAGDAPVLSLSLDALKAGIVRAVHAPGEPLYGMRGYSFRNARDARVRYSRGLERGDGAPVAAGAQGDGGAPFAFTKRWGLFVDSVNGDFSNDAQGTLEFRKGSRPDIEAYVVLGPPKRSIEVLTDLTGHPPLPHKWTLGFLNSQWGDDEAEISGLVDTYRAHQIPLDAFILDFDFKAWGEDNFGEVRWNSTSGPGSVNPDRFPDGASGRFAASMLARGAHVVGIMKPRFLIETPDHKPTEAAKEADAHGWWLPGQKPYMDYFSHRLTRDVDFAQPAARRWYWSHAKGLFDAGIAGWWNDEADDGFDSLAFMHMQQALYEGQRSVSHSRVWSINRNFYAGAQRFAFGTWSGDIGIGFPTMARQRERMLATLDLGQPHWSMDSGGFGGHPSPENYARWIEFASVVPIMRVHGTFGQKRQPWVYGPVAEAAAKKAIEFRMALQPSLYSWEREAHDTGIGIVRPLFWEFPGDANCDNDTDAWMLGDGLLAAPVCEQGAKSVSIYLPPGEWTRYGSNERYSGGQGITLPVDSENWSDLPLFVRSGTILATQPVLQFADQLPVRELTLDIWPDRQRKGHFRVYDDDGKSYDYERGDFFSQTVDAIADSGGVEVTFQRPTGHFSTSIKTYRIRVHAEDGHVTEKVIPAGRRLSVHL